MIWRFAKGIWAGCLATAVIAISEAFSGGGSATPAFFSAILASFLLLLPLGIGIGIGTSAVRFLLPEHWQVGQLREFLKSNDQTRGATAITVLGLGSLILSGLIYRINYHFLTGYHHDGLAALALTVLVPVSGLIALFLLWRLSLLYARFLERTERLSLLRNPGFSLGLVLLACGAVVLPPIFRGPEASGFLGFLGLLRKDGLGLGPVLSFSALFVLVLVLRNLVTPPKKHTLLATLLLVLLGLGGPGLAQAVLIANRDTTEFLDSGDGMMGPLLAAGRRLSDNDGDGHGTLLGGIDCDDTNPNIHPGAREIADNGVDEDCRDGDLQTAQLANPIENPAGSPKPETEQKPPTFPDDISLLLITVDTWRFDAAGFMGYPRDVTPNIDRVAAKGVVYERAYGIGSYTAQAIPPLLTGKYGSELQRNNAHETRISSEEIFAAELICGEKVKCAGILSHFLFKPRLGWNQGFDEWVVVGADPKGPGHIDAKYNSHIVANQAIKWLDNPENTAGSFWLWAHFMDPHKEYLEHPGHKTFGRDRRSRYDHELLFTDYHIGRVLDAFNRTEAAERTVIWITADHGEAFNEHGRFCHGKELWEEIIRVPMVVAGAGLPQKRIKRPTSQINFFATVLNLFGAPIPKGRHGRSLLPDWVKGQELPEVSIIADQPKHVRYETRRVFIHDGWKLHHLPDTGKFRLFELTDDYERGASLVDERPNDFARIKAAYDRFLATEFFPIDPIDF